MHHILLIGSGRIGGAIARMLSYSGDYALRVTDHDPKALEKLSDLPDGTETFALDVNDADALHAAMDGCEAVICALSFRFSVTVAQAALACGLSYFDLTEDLAVTRQVHEFAGGSAEGQIFMPQCGLAPGFTAIIANDLVQRLERVENVHVRVGALPMYPSNSLKYNLTWSTDGLINEYCQPCETLLNGELINVPPLSELETFSIDGTRYEAFHTSGGLGSLCASLKGKARTVSYKTVRYPGHRDLVRFLIDELKFGEKRDLLRDILEAAIPVTSQDLVLIFCTATGWKNGSLTQITDARKIYHAKLRGAPWSAIQITTAAGVCAAVDLHCNGQLLPARGLVRQEDVPLATFLDNRFGRHFAIGNTDGTEVETLDAVTD